MTQTKTLAKAQAMLARLAAPVSAQYPLVVVDEMDVVANPLRPRIKIAPTNGITTVKLVRDPCSCEGSARIEMKLNFYEQTNNEIEYQITQAINEVVGMLQIDAQIVSAGDNPLKPGHRWYTCYPFMIEAARHWGWDLDGMVMPAEIIGHDGGGVIIRNEREIMTNLLTGEADGAKLHCARSTYRHHLRCGRLSILGPDGKTSIAQYSDHDIPAVFIPNQQLPDTVLVAVEGRKIGDVIDDSRLGPMRDLKIKSARKNDTGLFFGVYGDRFRMDGGKDK